MKIKFLMISIALLALAACSGGGGGPVSVTGGGETGSAGTTTGTVTGFGSIYVNGVEFDTSDTSFDIDDAPGQESDLEVGHVVTIEGTVNPDGRTGVAEHVSFEDDLEGPISSIDPASQTFVVVGQTVIVDDLTSFDDDIVPASFEGLAVGDFVEVSGYADAEGNIRATRVEVETGDDREIEVKGIVSDLDSAASTFQINDLVVDFSSATLNDFSDGMIADGDYVEVKGTDFGLAGELLATEVESEDDRHDNSEDDDVEIEGYITAFDSADSFSVSGMPVTTNSQTQFEHGSIDDLALNVMVEVEGVVDADGVLVAREVEFRDHQSDDDSYLKIEAAVQDVDIAAGTLAMLGITINVDEMTRIEDDSDSDVRRFSLDDIQVGDFIEVRGIEILDADGVATGEIRALRLERDDADDEVSLQGVVTGFSGTTLTILGVTIDTHAGTEFEDDDNSLNSAEFFAMLSVGSVVEAEGIQVSDAGISADELEFED